MTLSGLKIWRVYRDLSIYLREYIYSVGKHAPGGVYSSRWPAIPGAVDFSRVDPRAVRGPSVAPDRIGLTLRYMLRPPDSPDLRHIAHEMAAKRG